MKVHQITRIKDWTREIFIMQGEMYLFILNIDLMFCFYTFLKCCFWSSV